MGLNPFGGWSEHSSFRPLLLENKVFFGGRGSRIFPFFLQPLQSWLKIGGSKRSHCRQMFFHSKACADFMFVERYVSCWEPAHNVILELVWSVVKETSKGHAIFKRFLEVVVLGGARAQRRVGMGAHGLWPWSISEGRSISPRICSSSGSELS